MKKKILAAAVGAMLLGGSAMAAVSVSQGGKGDVLIAPMFFTGGGWESEVKVINSSPTDSVVAKVVFHEGATSAEVLDFLIFLTPGDVWNGKLVRDAAGSVFLKSDDDSSLAIPAVSGSSRCPAVDGTLNEAGVSYDLRSAVNKVAGFDEKVELGKVTGFSGDNFKFRAPADVGYVNIFATAVFKNTNPVPYSKAKLAVSYSDACAAVLPIQNANHLTGVIQLSNPQNGNILALPMTALADYKNQSYHGVGSYTGFVDNEATALSKKADVEAALWASDFVVPFNNEVGKTTFATVTFPTKEAFGFKKDPVTGVSTYSFSPYFGAIATASPKVSYVIRNESEDFLQGRCYTSPCEVTEGGLLPNELTLVSISATENNLADLNKGIVGTKKGQKTFNKGWVALNPQSVSNALNGNKQGSPALVTHIQWTIVGNSMQGAWSYAASTK